MTIQRFTFRFMLLFLLLLTPTAVSADWTALHEAAKKGKAAVVKRLLAAGAAVEARDEGRPDAVALCGRHGQGGRGEAAASGRGGREGQG